MGHPFLTTKMTIVSIIIHNKLVATIILKRSFIKIKMEISRFASYIYHKSKRGGVLMRRVVILMLVISIILTGCAPKTESIELVYRFVPTGECPTIEEYVNHLNEDCDDWLYYVLDDNDYAHMMDKSEYDDWMQRTRAENWYDETFMDTLEAATGIDFRNYVTHYEADVSLMEFELYMNKEMVNEFISHYDTQGQMVFIILLELMQARLMIDPDVRYSRICVYDSETQDLLYDTGKITIESAYEQMQKR